MVDIRYNLEEIVNDLKEVTNYDINFITTDGIILYSTNPARIGNKHLIGKEVCLTRKTIEVNNDQIDEGVRPGINSPIVINGNVVGCIGVTGDPEDVRHFQAITKKLTERYILAQLYFQDSSSSKKLNYKIIKRIIHGRSINVYTSDLIAKELLQNKNMYLVAIYDLTDSEINRCLVEYQTSRLCASDDGILYFIIDSCFLSVLKEFTSSSNGQMIVGQYQNKYNHLTETFTDIRIMSAARKLLPQITDLNEVSINRITSYEYYFNHKYYYTHVINKLRDKFNEPTVDKFLKLYIVYIENDKSISETAQVLHLTTSTVKYQLNKLHQQLDLSKSLDHNFILYTAAKIYEIDN